MTRTRIAALAAFVSLVAATHASAQDGGAVTRLRAFDEVPALSTPGGGRFHADIVGDEIHYELEYFNLRGNVTQSHLHFGQKGVNGGIVIFLCSNLGNGPAGTQACPPDGTATDPAVVTGTLTAEDVTGAAAQGIAAGELNEVLRAIRAGIVYANVHTDLFPGGEVRGQLKFSAGESAAELLAVDDSLAADEHHH